MTEAEWTACQDPEGLLAAVAATSSPAALRKLACACCRRVLERFPDEWATQIFREETGASGGYISPDDWQGPLLREAVRVAEAFSSSRESARELLSTHALAERAVDDLYRAWMHANRRLGDAATGAEYEVGYVAWRATSAARDCCSEDIRASLGNCLNNAVEALGFRWNDSEQAKAIKRENAAMAELIREVLSFPGDSA